MIRSPIALIVAFITFLCISASAEQPVASSGDAQSISPASLKGGIAIASAERVGEPLRITLAAGAAEFVKIDLSCSVFSADSPKPVGIRPALTTGEAISMAPVQYAMGGQAAVTGAYATGIWQAAQDGLLTFSMETTGRGELTGCTLVGHRL